MSGTGLGIVGIALSKTEIRNANDFSKCLRYKKHQ